MSYICNLYPVALVIVLLNDWSLEEADANGANGVVCLMIYWALRMTLELHPPWPNNPLLLEAHHSNLFHARAHTHTHTHTHTQLRTHAREPSHAYMHTRMHARDASHACTDMRTRRHEFTHACHTRQSHTQMQQKVGWDGWRRGMGHSESRLDPLGVTWTPSVLLCLFKLI